LSRFQPGGGFFSAIFTPERRQDLLGLFLIALGAFTLINLLPSQQGTVGGAWLSFLERLFGWGMIVIPLVLLVAGLRIIFRRLEGRFPSLDQEQIVGLVLLYWLGLTFLHALLGATTWVSGLAFARDGWGGGLVGASSYALLVRGLGFAGSAVVLIAWTLIAVTFTAGISVPELITLLMQGWDWVKDQFTRVPVNQTTQRRQTFHPGETHQRSGAEAAASEMQEVRTGAVQETAPETASEPEPVEWVLPEIDQILKRGAVQRADAAFDRERAKLIEETLVSFGAPAKVVEINRGPVITQFGVEPSFVEGRGGRRTKVKVSKISALADDLALALAAPSIRIEAPVPGKGFIGIEVPNTEVTMVALRDVMESQAFGRYSSNLRLGLGKDVSGNPIAADLGTMPHLLIAGTTGSGKSVCVNAIVSCLLLQNTPDDLQFVMVDPKRVELTYFNGIPHLLAPVVVELERVVPALQWVAREMDSRYQQFAEEGLRNIDDYNRRMKQSGRKKMHYIVVVIDELADLMMLSPHETEQVITRLAQLARATGIHLVIATQRPSVDVVTGLIKANFPARIAFAVASGIDSRVILDQPGAERLLGRGDMLFQAPDAPAPIRMQGAYVSEGELSRLIRYWKLAGVELGEEDEQSPTSPADTIPNGADLEQGSLWEEVAAQEELDPIFNEAVQVVREAHKASISMLQRRLRIGYTRAARIVDQMEAMGIIGPAQSGSQPREVLDYGDDLNFSDEM
jgi:S-DNA-T family DNA segregation ATPase FtsK/SpoIIIE